MNRELLLKVRDHILEEPKRLNMREWMERSSMSPCGTVACIAGWACILSGEKPTEEYDFQWNAERLLKFDFDLADSDGLFMASDWPLDFRTKLGEYEPGTQEYAQVVAARIDHFVEHGE